MLKIIILLNIILKIEIFCLRPNDFCFKNEKICTGQYSNLVYTVKCEEMKCKKPFSNGCVNYCTTNEETCKNFLTWNYRTLESSSPIMSKKYKSFISSIKNCLTLKPKQDNFCLNGKNCSKFFIDKSNFKSVMDCKCPKEKSFVCGKYCTRDSTICKALNKAKIEKINSCDNSNTIYYVLSKYFNGF